MAGIGLTLFDSGTLTSGGVAVPVPFFLIEHPDGNAIVDGGNPSPSRATRRAHWGEIAKRFVADMTEEQHCAAQLERHGVPADSIRYVIQTHLHIDHTGARSLPRTRPSSCAREPRGARAPRTHRYPPATRVPTSTAPS